MKTLWVWLSLISVALVAGCVANETAPIDPEPAQSAAEETALVSEPSSYFRPAAVSKVDVSAWESSRVDDAELDRIELQLLKLRQQIREIEVSIEEMYGYVEDPNTMLRLVALNERRIALEAQRDARLSLYGISRTPEPPTSSGNYAFTEEEEWALPEDPNDPTYLACEADRRTLGEFGENYLCLEGMLIPLGWLDNIEPAAAAGAGEYCQVRLAENAELIITCEQSYDPNLPLTQARVEQEGELEQQLLEIAKTLAGPQWEMGRFRASLCYLDMNIELDDERAEYLLLPCESWMGVLEDRFEVMTEGDLDLLRGRIGHHAPSEMVVAQPYYLQLAILPIANDGEELIADVQIASAMDSGLMDPDAASGLNIEFTTANISNQMSVSLIGSGFDIVPISPERQPIQREAPTIWEFEVTPQTEGRKALTYSVSQSIMADGERVNRQVERLRVPVLVSTIDSLLAEPEPPQTSVMASMPPKFDASPAVSRGISSTDACADIANPGSDPTRQALLMTNASYQSPITELSMTHADGERLSAALASIGFNVRHCRDLERATAMRELRGFGRKLKPMTDAGEQTLAFFYYSGHGANVDQINYIIPVDTEGATPGAIADGGVRFEDVFMRLSNSVSVASVVVFDACRTVMSEDSRGLIPTYQPVGWVSGALQAFATAPGQTAADDGLYAEVLSNLLTSIDEPAGTVFKRVQDTVSLRTAGRQKPVYIDATVGGEIFFQGTDN